MTLYGGPVKPIRPHNYLQTMMRPRDRRMQVLQIVLALAVLAALFFLRPSQTQSFASFGGAAHPAILQAQNAFRLPFER